MNTNTKIPYAPTILKNVADSYKKKTYSKGDRCINFNKLWKANQNISVAEDWNYEHWDQTTIDDELKSLIPYVEDEILYL